MKKLLLMLLVVCFSAKAEQTTNLLASDVIIWAGLDYSLVKIYGREKSDSFYAFAKAKNLFPEMLNKWNQLFLDEQIDSMSTMLNKKFIVDIGGVKQRNKTASTNQLILNQNIRDVTFIPSVTLVEIAREVRSYQMQQTNGLGLVFIIDKLVEESLYGSANRLCFGAVYVVFFDVSTRQLIYANREIYMIKTGGNFQNFWFGPIKDADETLVEVLMPRKPAVSPTTIRSRS